jgi:LPS sulfotransferase NodH
MPYEFFSRRMLHHWIQVWQLPVNYSADMFCTMSRWTHTTPNGVHGVKLFYDHLTASPLTTLAAQHRLPPEAMLHRLYPAARFLHLSRRDLRGQALSYARALLTDVWFESAPGYQLLPITYRASTVPPLHPPLVLQCEQEICEEEQRWVQFYQRHGITPLRLTYETMLDNIPNTITQVLRWLQLDPQAAAHLPPPRLRMQRDALTCTWRAMMQAWAPEIPNPYAEASL